MAEPINKSVITSEDIFMKAAIRYCDRTGVEPFGTFQARAFQFRDELADLAERILALKEAGVL